MFFRAYNLIRNKVTRSFIILLIYLFINLINISPHIRVASSGTLNERWEEIVLKTLYSELMNLTSLVSCTGSVDNRPFGCSDQELSL